MLNHVGVSCRHQDTSPRNTWVANTQEGFSDIVAPRRCSWHGPLGPTLSLGTNPGHPESRTEILSPSLGSCPVNRHPTFPLFNIALSRRPQRSLHRPSLTGAPRLFLVALFGLSRTRASRGDAMSPPEETKAQRGGVTATTAGWARPRLPLWVSDGYSLPSPPPPGPDGRAPLGAHLSLLWT